MNRQQLKQEAKQCISSSNAHPYITTILFLVVIAVISLISNNIDMPGNVFAGVIAIVLAIVNTTLMCGYKWWALSVSRENGSVGEIAYAFTKIIPIILISILTDLAVVIGLIILIFPGIILALGFSMSLYVLKDNPDIGITKAISASWRITKGYKGDLFMLALSFVPWLLLTSITCGLVGIYTIPYITVTYAKVYETLSSRINEL